MSDGTSRKSILQHTATHCNTLQHAATRCDTLQHTAPQCNNTSLPGATHHCHMSNRPSRKSMLKHTATHCHTLQHAATHCNTLQHAATRCITLQYTYHYQARNIIAIGAIDLLERASCNTLHHTATRCNNTSLPVATHHCHRSDRPFRKSDQDF